MILKAEAPICSAFENTKINNYGHLPTYPDRLSKTVYLQTKIRQGYH